MIKERALPPKVWCPSPQPQCSHQRSARTTKIMSSPKQYSKSPLPQSIRTDQIFRVRLQKKKKEQTFLPLPNVLKEKNSAPPTRHHRRTGGYKLNLFSRLGLKYHKLISPTSKWLISTVTCSSLFGSYINKRTTRSGFGDYPGNLVIQI